MKKAFLTLSLSLLCWITYAHGQSELLNGTWYLSGLRCENGSAPNSAIMDEIMTSTRKFEVSYTTGGAFSADVEQGPCSIVSSGSFSANSYSIQMNISDVKAMFCAANKGSYSVQYTIQNGSLLIYQPLGYHQDDLCGPGVRGIQVLTKK